MKKIILLLAVLLSFSGFSQINPVTFYNYTAQQQQQPETTYYVRPAGGTYGTGDGTSYANAWSGASAINTTLIEGNRLAICGTHTEAFSFNGVNTHLIGNDVNEAGVINCTDTLNRGLTVSNATDFEITGLTVIDAVVSCIEFDNVTGATYNCTTTGSGNQGVQHLNTYSLTHENLNASNNVDDGISGHEAGTIYVIGGTFTNNESAINVIAGCNVFVFGNPTFSGNIDDLWAANATTPESCTITATNCNFPTKVRATNGAKIVLNNCTTPLADINASVGSVSYLTANNSVIDNLNSTGGSISNINDSRLNDITTISASGVITARRSYIKPVGVFDVNGTFRAYNCLIDAVDCTDHTIDVNSGGTLMLEYCVLKNTISNKYALSLRSGSIIEALNGITIDGRLIGRGIFTQTNLTVRNLILSNLSQSFNAATGTISTVSNYNIFNCGSSAGSGVVTLMNSVTGNPLYTDAANNNYFLQAGSPCLNTGQSITNNIGFNTANWGNSTTAPVVTTKTLTSFNIGAF